MKIQILKTRTYNARHFKKPGPSSSKLIEFKQKRLGPLGTFQSQKP